MAADGWIKLYRKSYNNFLYKTNKPHTRREAWEDLLLNVNFCDSFWNLGNEKIECKKGQSLMSLESWGNFFNWDKSRVKRFFQLLQNEKMIVVENLRKTTRITICNYEEYQCDQYANETQMKQERNANETQMKPIEEEKERKNVIIKEIGEEVAKFEDVEIIILPEKKEGKIRKKREQKIFTAPEIEEVQNYFIENGYTKESGLKAWKYYNSANWFDSKGNQVLNWKQKMIIIWFKPENKSKEVPKQVEEFTPEQKEYYARFQMFNMDAE